MLTGLLGGVHEHLQDAWHQNPSHYQNINSYKNLKSHTHLSLDSLDLWRNNSILRYKISVFIKTSIENLSTCHFFRENKDDSVLKH